MDGLRWGPSYNIGYFLAHQISLICEHMQFAHIDNEVCVTADFFILEKKPNNRDLCWDWPVPSVSWIEP